MQNPAPDRFRKDKTAKFNVMSPMKKTGIYWSLASLLLAGVVMATTPKAANKGAELSEEAKEEVLRLKAAAAAWKQGDQEFRELSKTQGVSQSELQEFAGFVAELKRELLVHCATVQASTGNAEEHCADCSGFQEKLKKEEEKQQPTVAEVKREQTQEEKMAQLDRELASITADFDRELLKHSGGSPAVSGGSGGSSSNPPPSKQGGGAGTPKKEAGIGAPKNPSAQPGGKQKQKQPPPPKAEPGAGPGVKKDKIPNTGEGAKADGSDDDVVARQLREAAEAETDPIMKEKLWKEYRKYKQEQK